MVTWADIQQWQAPPLDEANRSLDKGHDHAVETADDITYAINSIASSGAAAEAAAAALNTDLAHTNTFVSLSAALMLATAAAANGVADVATKVHDCHTTAQICRIDISAEGTASISQARTEEINRHLDEHSFAHAMLAAMQDRDNVQKLIDEAVRFAQQVDETYAAALDKVIASDASGVEGADSFAQGLPDRPNPNWSEREVAAWWNALTQDEKTAIINTDPDAIGNLNGIDAASRDRANRNRLPNLISDATAEVERLEAKFNELANNYFGGNEYELSEAARALQAARNQLADLRAVEHTLAHNNETSLLVLDAVSEDQVLAAVAVGNVDAAAHVATIVPGMTTNLRDSLENYTDDVALMRNIAAVESGVPLDKIATVAWLGYDAPQSLGQELNVVSTAQAERGAVNLNGFMEGLSASRNQGVSPDPNLSLFGHSYGSTTAGMATRDVQVGVVDSLTMFGSPGSGVQDIREYNIGTENVHVSAVPNGDMVQGIGTDWNFGKNPTKLEGIDHLSSDDGLTEKPSWSPISRHSTYFDVPTGKAETNYTEAQLQNLEQLGFTDPDRNTENFKGATTGILSDFGRIITDRK